MLEPVRVKMPAPADADQAPAKREPDRPTPSTPVFIPSLTVLSGPLSIRCTITSKDKLRLIKTLDADLVAALFPNEFPDLAA